MYYHRCTNVFIQSTRYSCHILINPHIFRQKKPQTSNFIKIRPVGTELFHADKHTDIPQPIFAFRNFSDAPRNLIFY